MEERNAKKLALACSVAGLAILYFSMQLAEQSALPVKLSELGIENVGASAKACGNVTETRTSNGHVFVQISDGTGSLRIVVFNNTAARLNRSGQPVYSMPAGSVICASGQVQEYPPGSGGIEVVAGKVWVSK